MERFDVYLVVLDPTIGSEIQKTRPCVIVSPDEMNQSIVTRIVAPMTTTVRNYPTRTDCVFQGKAGQIALDQLRTVDRFCLVKRLGRLEETEQQIVLQTLAELFAP